MAKRRHVNTYRSGLEDKAIKLLTDRGIEHSYETLKLKYTKPISHHVYTPDLILGDKIYELKGYIPDLATRMKYVYVKEQNPDINLIMVFQNPNLKIGKNSKTTYKEWFEKRGFETMSYLEFEREVVRQK